ncbi:hypothetical protein SEA_HERBERTWM_79 [Mycobacterium phage Herbertwm]|nr:hypothetical protein SEA_HERBERTWM_79 [Mycobacterium phage Herbertwm]
MSDELIELLNKYRKLANDLHDEEN